MIPNARFVELLQDIEPSSTTKQNASSAHTSVREHLQTQTEFKEHYVTSFLSGSYARDTSIRPASSADGTERPDVDIIVVTNYTEVNDPENVLNEVADALEDEDEYEVVRINKRSVRIEPWQAEMDIVPVFQVPGGYMISDRETGTWKFTNPPEHTNWSTRQNIRLDGRFKPLVKLFKWWRRTNPTSSKRPKGFVLEALTAQHAPTGETHYGEAFAQLLENIRDTYALSASVGIKPMIDDPAVPGSDILAKVSVAQWKEFIEKVGVYADIARRAQSAEDYEEATRQWRRVFGDRFKQTTSAAKAETAGTFAAAAPPAGGYNFPNQPATPSKPRGFA